LLERGYGAVRRSVAEWSKQQQPCYVAPGKKKREKSEEKEKKEKWPVGPRKWASQGWAEQGKIGHEF
jgi:CRISPR/Cas system CSM-associated protein Csm3 (group 7 of RAMP superfamily)